ncbi:MAG: hypothetical protein K9G70_09510, partial [Prolixibacteraceae bacterium]|nr:hypothetical protein [Prolixibacteraceae bacterium]
MHFSLNTYRQIFKTIRRVLLVAVAMVLVSFCLPLQLSAQNTETFTSNGTFTVPPGVTQITVQAWGGGGGGADRSTNYSGERYGGGGGGGGGFASGVLLVSAGDVITITVGNGGEGGSSNGVNGG